ncbi:MAG: transposase [Gaiellaceae bacterium]
MPRILRTTLPDGYFHAYSRAVYGGVLFADDVDHRLFLKLLMRAAKRCGWQLHALCLMTTHYHVVLETTVPYLAVGMQWLNGLYAQRFNQRHERFGHVFAGRYGTRVVETEEYLQRACSYVLLNPVRAGLCDRAVDWPWNATRHDFPN